MPFAVPRSLRILLLILAITCLLGWLFKVQCTPGGWTASEQYTTGCYSDAVPFWSGRGVAAGEIPYLQARMEYPVLTGAAIWIEGGLARLLGGQNASAVTFLNVVTLANALLAAMVLVLLYRAGMDRWRLLAWAAAPPLILYVGHNWDMLAVTFAVGAMLLARSGRLVTGAAVAGLGVAAKLFPVLLLPLIGMTLLFREGEGWPRRMALGAAAAAAAIAAWAVVNLPIALAAPVNWSEFYTFSQERSGTAASVWELLAMGGWWQTTIEQRNLYAGLLFLVGAGAIVLLGWRRHCGALWVLFPPVLAWFMLTNKVYSPQFDLWLWPVALMVAPRFAPLALFAAADVAAYFAEFWWFAGREGAWPSATPTDIGIAAAIRAAAMLWFVADAVRNPAPAWLAKPSAETTPAAP